MRTSPGRVVGIYASRSFEILQGTRPVLLSVVSVGRAVILGRRRRIPPPSPRRRRPPRLQRRRRRRPAPELPLVDEARPARNGGAAATAAPPPGLPRAAQRAQGRVLDGRLLVVRQGQLDEAVEVLEHLRIPLHRGLPVLVDAALQLGLGGGDVVRVRRRVEVVEGVPADALQVCGVGCFPPVCQEAEVLQDVVLGVRSDPGPGRGFSV